MTGYVFVDELGNLMCPDYLTGYFPQYIQKHGLRRMRFHDLRHSCAFLFLANGVPLKQIQDWLGHSDFSTTANIYAHLDYSSKLSSAQAIVSGMTLPETVDFGSKRETAAKKMQGIKRRAVLSIVLERTAENQVIFGVSIKKSRNPHGYWIFRWRRRWDSNPRPSGGIMISSHVRYDHFDTSPNIGDLPCLLYLFFV